MSLFLLFASAVLSAPLLQINQTSNLALTNQTTLDHEFAQAWVPSSSVRSSWEILYSCLTALVACFIKFVPMKMPAHDDSKWTRCLRKLKWLVLTIFIPELVVYRAWRQFTDARKLRESLLGLWHKKTSVSTQLIGSWLLSHWAARHRYFCLAYLQLLVVDTLKSFYVTNFKHTHS